MNKQYRIGIDIINLIIRFMVFFTFTSFIFFSITEQYSYIVKGLLLLPAAIISYLIRKYTKNIWSFIALHLVLLTAYIILSNDVILRGVFGINIIALGVTEFVLSLKNKVKNSSLALSVIFIAMYMFCISVYPQYTILKFLFFSIAIAFGILYIINMYCVNSYYYFSKHEDKVNIPLRKIRSSNILYIVGFILLSLIVMILFSQIPLGGFSRVLKAGFIALVKFIITVYMLLWREPEEITSDEEIIEDYYQFVDKEPSLLAEILSYILAGATIITALILIVYGLRKIYDIFHSRTEIYGEDRIKEITTFIKADNSTGNKSSLRRGILSLFGRSNNIRIRRQYMRAVLKNAQPDKSLKYKLPNELSEYAFEIRDSDLDESSMQKRKALLTAIYEKARYSNIECSKEEVQMVKDILN